MTVGQEEKLLRIHIPEEGKKAGAWGTRFNPNAGGYELHTIEDIHITHRNFAMIPTGIRWVVPPFHAGTIYPSDELETQSVIAAARIVDCTYTGVLSLCFRNTGDKKSVYIRKHSLVGFMVLEKARTSVQFELTKRAQKLGIKLRQGYHGDAAWDLNTMNEIVVSPGHSVGVDAGIEVSIPRGCVGRIEPRTGFGRKGLIPDQMLLGYGKHILDSISLFNVGTETVEVPAGGRWAQLLVLDSVNGNEATEITEDQIPSTDRGEGNFGSTGVM